MPSLKFVSYNNYVYRIIIIMMLVLNIVNIN